MKFLTVVFSLLLMILVSFPSFAGGTGGIEPVKPKQADPRCAHRGEIGFCKALIESWHYDPGSNSCKSFFWGGCGEPQPFSSEKECLSVCSGQPK